MKEIEILFEILGNKEDTLRKLETLSPSKEKHTIDTYFFDPLRPDLKPDTSGRLLRSFRLRDKGGSYSLTYKVDHFNDGVWLYSDEFETKIDNFEIGLEIIKHIGLEELVRVDNLKHVFETAEYEIVLEEVKNLGLFLEVEKLGETPDEEIDQAKEEIRRFVKELGIKVGEEMNSGKPELLLKKLSPVI